MADAFLETVLSESGSCIYTSHVTCSCYSFKKLVVVKRKLSGKKVADFIVVKDYGQFIAKDIVLHNWETGDMEEMGFLLKFALMRSILLLKTCVIFDLKKLFWECSSSDILLTPKKKEKNSLKTS